MVWHEVELSAWVGATYQLECLSADGSVNGVHQRVQENIQEQIILQVVPDITQMMCLCVRLCMCVAARKQQPNPTRHAALQATKSMHQTLVASRILWQRLKSRA